MAKLVGVNWREMAVGEALSEELYSINSNT
jgi:hypothetical protein